MEIQELPSPLCEAATTISHHVEAEPKEVEFKISDIIWHGGAATDYDGIPRISPPRDVYLMFT